MSAKYIFFIIVLFAMQQSVFAQFSFMMRTDHEYNSNPFRIRTSESDYISSYNLAAQYEKNNIIFSYDGALVNFNKNGDRNFFLHSAFVRAEFDSSSLSASLEQRVNKTSYSYLNYYNAALTYEAQYNILGMEADISPMAAYTSYKDLSILNNVKLSANISLNKGFETKTTLIIGGAVNHKIYTEPKKTGFATTEDENNQFSDVLIESTNASDLTQLSFFARIAQSVASNTGVAFQYTRRKIIHGLSNSVKELNLVYGDESEIFDDPVNYNVSGIYLGITQLLFEDMQVKLGYYYSVRDYPSQGVYKDDYSYFYDETRKDIQNIYSFEAEKSFSLSENITLNAGIEYTYYKNNSNSYYFTYKSGGLNINLSLLF